MPEWLSRLAEALTVPILIGIAALVRKVDQQESTLRGVVERLDLHEAEDRMMHQRYTDMRVSIERLAASFEGLKSTLDELRDDLRAALQNGTERRRDRK